MYYKNYTTDPGHIDVQGIMDGLYYPFYLEQCRHDYLKEILEFDLEKNAREGVNIVLAQYTIKFLRPLKKDDEFKVSCYCFADKEKPKIYFRQKIEKDEKVMTDGIFTATCIPAAGGRPFIPDSILKIISTFPELDHSLAI
ncbi:MAG: acyl-CoA thioesterase [Bacteroidetes bacterium]|nr:acyl-CoA thioesterase [Bacteroidota bacterium]